MFACMQINFFQEKNMLLQQIKCGQKGPENRHLTKKKAALLYHANMNEVDECFKYS